MMISQELLKDVLSYINERKILPLSTESLDPRSGFNWLRQKGYIRFENIEGVYSATLTNKGFEVIANHKES